MRCRANGWCCGARIASASSTTRSPSRCCAQARIACSRSARISASAAAARCSTSRPTRSSRSSRSQLIENLSRLGAVHAERLLEPLRGPVWNYRRRARLGIKLVPRKGKVLVGFRERSSPYVADLHECHVLVEPVGALITPLGQMVEGLTIASRVPQAEVAVSDDVVALVLRVLDPPAPADLERMAAFEREHSVRIYLQPGGPDTIAPLDPAHRAGAAQLPAAGARRRDRVRADRLRAGQRRAEPGDDRARARRARAAGGRHRARPVLRPRQFLAAARPAHAARSWPSKATQALVQPGARQRRAQWHHQRRVPRGRPVQGRGGPALGPAALRPRAARSAARRRQGDPARRRRAAAPGVSCIFPAIRAVSRATRACSSGSMGSG